MLRPVFSAISTVVLPPIGNLKATTNTRVAISVFGAIIK
jgi:hypothetical protein